MKKVLLVFVSLLLCSGVVMAQDNEKKSKKTKVIFEQGSSELDFAFDNNAAALAELDELLGGMLSDGSIEVKGIEIESAASPEGQKSLNQRLAQERGNALFDFITEKYGISSTLFTVKNNGVQWDELRDAVAASDMPEKEKVIAIIDNVPEETWKRVNAGDRWLSLTDSRNKHLMDHRRGKTYNYMLENIYPNLRQSSVITVFYEEMVVVEETEPANANAAAPVEEEAEVVEEVAEPAAAPAVEYYKEPIFALKTNLLFDAAMVPNLELEVPIGDRFSIAAEYMYAPWCKENTWAWYLQQGALEARYWFGDRTKKEKLEGWFVGLFAQSGIYDFQLEDTKGIQGDYCFAGGISGGYSFKLNNHFNLELSAGLGYLIGDHWDYEVENNEKLVQYEPTESLKTIFPAKAKVSLVWKILGKKKVK